MEHGLLMENLLDLAHAPFTHTSTFAKGWPIPDSVKFKAAEYLGGNWEPYPIDMTFQPPCCVQSTIGLAQPGKILRGQRADACKNHLHQLHVCLPSKPGHTRLLYRMSMDFMQWVRWVPFIQKFWQQIAGQVQLFTLSPQQLSLSGFSQDLTCMLDILQSSCSILWSLCPHCTKKLLGSRACMYWRHLCKVVLSCLAAFSVSLISAVPTSCWSAQRSRSTIP